MWFKWGTNPCPLDSKVFVSKLFTQSVHTVKAMEEPVGISLLKPWEKEEKDPLEGSGKIPSRDEENQEKRVTEATCLSFYGCCKKNYHKPDGLRHHKLIILQFLSSEV